MSVMIELPPDVVRKLRDVGNDAEAVQRVIIEESAALAPRAIEAIGRARIHAPIQENGSEHILTSPRRADGLTDEEFYAIYEKLTAIMKDHPTTYNGTYTREEIYEDHP